VICVSKTGKSGERDRGHITPRNIKEYLPEEATLRQAAAELQKLGFHIDLTAPTHLNISGQPALFERVFHAKLTPRGYPLSTAPNSKPRQTVWQSDGPLDVPAALQKLVDAVNLDPGAIYYTSATPPVLGYDHLEVPLDVARGMDAIKAIEKGITGLGIQLAMVDSGFMNPVHPYYVGKGYTLNPTISDSSDPSPGSDDYGHGTGISACALAVAPGVSYTVYKAYPALSAAFSRAAMDNPHIITNSWGYFSLDTALQMAINNAVANGIVVCFAAGNGGPAAWPGSEPAVISVGGAFLGDDDSIQASTYASSGINPIVPGRQIPDVCGLVGMAPNGIYIALPTQPDSTVDNEFGGGVFPNGDETPTNDGWVVASGTSSATPMVAATCALMMQADPSLIGDPAAVKAKLIATCVDVTTGMSAAGEAAGAGADNATGAGLVQAYRAVHNTDIWMKDNTDSDIGLVPTTGRRPAYPPFAHWTSGDIKVVAAALVDPQADFEGVAEVEPIFNQDNFVYARVRNRGTHDATGVQVRLYYADPSTSLSFPHDWNDGQTGVPAKGSITVAGMGTDLQALATIPANGSVVTPDAFVWRPPDPTTATQSQTLPDGRVRGHFCLLSRLTTADDPITFPGGGGSSVINDNNIAMKNEEVYSAAAGGMFAFQFYTRYARLPNVREFQLVADLSKLPARTELAIEIPAKKISDKYTVEHVQVGIEKAAAASVSEAEYDDYPVAAMGAGTATARAVAPPLQHHAEPLVLASISLEPDESALVKVGLHIPKGTAKGRYPVAVGQKGGTQMVGGVTMVAEVTK
jgi:serine protease AprX